MRANAGIFCIIFLLLLVGGVEGSLPDTSTIITSNPWVIANGADQATITVTVSNESSGRIPGASVSFAIDDLIYGTLSPVTTIADAEGNATSIFKANYSSGAAAITAMITSNDGYTIIRTVTQNIDHDSPYYSYFSYPLTGEVDSEIPFNVSVTDRWKNPVDERKEIALGLPLHNLTLHIHGPAPDDCYFVGYGHEIFPPPTLDANGNLSVILRLTTKIGNNYVLIDPFGSISEKIEWIVAEATGKPYSINGTISDGGILPVDTRPFTIDYFLYDQYGNPVRNQSIWVNTTLNEQKNYTSNSHGQIRLYYGPWKTAGNVTINATPFHNSSIMNTLVAQFIHSAPTNMVLAITPQTMASRELSTDKAYVRATVIDTDGNPVEGELVTFSLGAVTVDPLFYPEQQPYLENTTSTGNSLTNKTDINGNAIVFLYPGSFNPNYHGAATGSVIVTAIWNETSRSMLATWKNYAYLNISASAEPRNVKLNETFDITIDVIGEGYAMQGGNVAAMLDIDSSSSMWHNSDTPPSGYTCEDPTKCVRMDSAKAAANAFTTELLTPSPSTNWIGVDSFGYTKKVNPLLLPPQNNIVLVQNKIANIVEGSTSQGLVNSIIDSINNLTETQGSRPLDTVRAVVVLKDTADGGTSSEDPTAMVNLAKSTTPKTLVFAVYYNDGKGTAAMQTYLNNTATSTGGQFFMAANSAELLEVFKKIAGILKSSVAAHNATMNLNFDKIEQVANTTPIDGSVFSYVPVEPFYDLNSTIMSRDNVQGRTRIFWPNSSHIAINQSDQWTAPNYQLNFTIGTINISERWNATYRLKAISPTGLINLFNCTLSGSEVSAENAAPVCLPDLYITITNATPPTNLTGLDVSKPIVTKSSNITDYAPLEWNLIYSGYDTATETMWYSYENGPWVQFDTRTGIERGNYLQIEMLNVKEFTPGSYRVKVEAIAPEGQDFEISDPFWVGNTGVFIKLS